MSKLKKISIFIDSYNDVDHITPFVDYLLSNKKAKITLYKTKTSNLIGCEYHLQYLKEVYGLIPVYYDKDFSSMYIMLMSMYWKLCFFSNRAKRNWLYG